MSTPPCNEPRGAAAEGDSKDPDQALAVWPFAWYLHPRDRQQFASSCRKEAEPTATAAPGTDAVGYRLFSLLYTPGETKTRNPALPPDHTHPRLSGPSTPEKHVLRVRAGNARRL